MSSSHGQKVTTDPESYNNPKNENPGIVPADSLAAESIREGGSFAANSDARGPLDQTSRGLTANTTDTSGATRLDPAVDAEARLAKEGWGEDARIQAGAGLGTGGGSGPTYDTTTSSGGSGGDSTGSTDYGRDSGPSRSGNESGSSHYGGSGGDSGSYVSGDQIADTTNQSSTGAVVPPSVASGPKGSNLTEGDLDDNAPRAKFDVEPGSQDDPGRRALLDTDVPVSGGAGPRQTRVSGDGQYDDLRDAEA